MCFKSLPKQWECDFHPYVTSKLFLQSPPCTNKYQILLEGGQTQTSEKVTVPLTWAAYTNKDVINDVERPT